MHVSAAAVHHVKEQVRSLLDGAEDIPAPNVINREFVQRCMFAMSAVGAVDALELLGLMNDEEAAAFQERLLGMGFEGASVGTPPPTVGEMNRRTTAPNQPAVLGDP